MSSETEQAADKSEMTISELFERWLESRKDILKPATYKRYHTKYRLYLEKQLGSTTVNSITPEQWIEYEKLLPTLKDRKGDPITPSIVKLVIRLCHNAFEYGSIEFGLNDPSSYKDLPSPDTASKNVFDHQEIELMKKAVKPYNIYHLCIMLCITTGITSGEICGARWGEIDVDSQMIKIRRSVVVNRYARAEKPKVWLTESRDKRTERNVQIPDWINDQLRLIKKMHKDDDYVVACRNGYMLPSNFVHHYYSEFLISAGVEYRPFSAARNTFAKNCIECGMCVEQLSLALGHPNTEHTKKELRQKGLLN